MKPGSQYGVRHNLVDGTKYEVSSSNENHDHLVCPEVCLRPRLLPFPLHGCGIAMEAESIQGIPPQLRWQTRNKLQMVQILYPNHQQNLILDLQTVIDWAFA